MNFYDKLEFLMESRNIKNLYALAAKCNVPYTTLRSFYSNGMNNVKLGTIEKLCKYFDVTLDYLMDEKITDSNYGKERPVLKLSFEAQKIAALFDKADDRDKQTIRNILGRYEERQLYKAAARGGDIMLETTPEFRKEVAKIAESSTPAGDKHNEAF